MNVRATLKLANTVVAAVLCTACATDAEQFGAFFNSQRGTSIRGISSGLSKQHGLELLDVREHETGKVWRFQQGDTGCQLNVETDLRDLIQSSSAGDEKRCRYIRSNFLLQQ